jgi:hypothetical protein
MNVVSTVVNVNAADVFLPEFVKRPHGRFHGLRHTAPDVRIHKPSLISFDVCATSIPLTGDVIAESLALDVAKGVTTWSRTFVFAHEDVIVVPATNVV